MSYVEGFVLAVPVANREAYRQQCIKAAQMFRDYGATRVVECWEDDVPDGKLTDFRRAVKAEPLEAVVFSWIEYPSREVRDEANRRMMAEGAMDTEMPFDGKRMIWGGFAPILES